MPELPEVETIRLQLDKVLPGLMISEVKIFKQKSFIGDKKYIIGERIVGIRRFGKLLVFNLSNGLLLAIHLKMSGQLVYRGIHQPTRQYIPDPLLKVLPNKHTRIIIEFSNSDRLYFNDLRIFGWMKIALSGKREAVSSKKYLKINDLIKNLGPEPLRDLTIDKFKDILKSSNKPVKLILMDQEKLSGVGNIYANDSLFLAGINPTIKAKTLNNGQMIKLLNCLEKVLKNGIKWGGASQNNFRDAFGEMGKVQEHFYVYAREGKKCLKCKANIKKMKLGGRGTFYCPVCQKVK